MHAALLELGNVARKMWAGRIFWNAASGGLSKEDYIWQMERQEFAAAQDALRVYDECQKTWDCDCAPNPYESVRDALERHDFEEYFKHVDEAHKEVYGDYWEGKFREKYLEFPRFFTPHPPTFSHPLEWKLPKKKTTC